MDTNTLAVVVPLVMAAALAVALIIRNKKKKKKKKEEEKVPQGLQVWDASGRMVLDTTSWAGRVSGVRTITGNFDFTVPKTSQETVFAVPVTSFNYHSNFTQHHSGRLTVTGNRIHGTFESPTKIVYGVY